MTRNSEDAERQLLRGRIEARWQLEKKSLRSTEALLEKNITEAELLDHCKNLWQQTYQGCTEERALGELCGYPLCDNPVPPQTKKLPTYRISLRKKKKNLRLRYTQTRNNEYSAMFNALSDLNGSSPS